MSARDPRRVKAPVSRFSSTVRCAKQWRPSITWITPRFTTCDGLRLSMRTPSKWIAPLVTSPRSACSRFETAFSVVVLPAPLAPRRATMPPSGTASETPFSTRITWLYMTSMPFTSRRGAVAALGSALMTPRSLALLLFRAIALRDLLLGRVGLGRRLDHRPDDLHVGLVPVRGVAPVL